MWDEHVAKKIMSYEDAKYYARKRAPRGIFDAYQAGSGPGVTAELNEEAFKEVLFKPLAAKFTTNQSLKTSVAGFELETPLIFSSVGGLKGAHQDGELAATHAASEFGAMQFVSGMTATPIETIVKEAKAPVFQQIYYVNGRDATKPMIERAIEAGVDGLVLIVDSSAPATGPDKIPPLRKMMPVKVNVKQALQFAPQLWNRPAWALDFLRGGLQAPMAEYTRDASGNVVPFYVAAGMLYQETPTFEDVEWIRKLWDGPIVLKGIIRPDDARRAVDVGADAIVVSNHGGNMLDTTIPTLRALPDVVAAVDGQTDVLIDGGIRRGSDIIKAMAMGAKAVGIGRGYVQGLLGAGEPGVMRMTELFRSQALSTLRWLGVDTVDEIDDSFLEFPASWNGLTQSDLSDEMPAPAKLGAKTRSTTKAKVSV